jgi:hypothetical protein
MSAVKTGDRVKVIYTICLENGARFRPLHGGDTLQFTMGCDAVLPGFERALLDMSEGETRRVQVAAEDAYGPYRPDKIFAMSRSEVLPEVEPLVTQNAIFDEEISMNEWSNSNSEWVPPSDSNIEMQDNKAVALLWHRSHSTKVHAEAMAMGRAMNLADSFVRNRFPIHQTSTPNSANQSDLISVSRIQAIQPAAECVQADTVVPIQ